MEYAKEIAGKRSELNSELSVLEIQISETPKLSIDQIIAGTKKTLQNLDLTDKKFIVKKIIDKIVATQKEATIWGHIPLLISEQVGYAPINRHSQDATIPFDITFYMPLLIK